MFSPFLVKTLTQAVPKKGDGTFTQTDYTQEDRMTADFRMAWQGVVNSLDCKVSNKAYTIRKATRDGYSLRASESYLSYERVHLYLIGKI